jgi:hypothetical protein
VAYRHARGLLVAVVVAVWTSAPWLHPASDSAVVAHAQQPTSRSWLPDGGVHSSTVPSRRGPDGNRPVILLSGSSPHAPPASTPGAVNNLD